MPINVQRFTEFAATVDILAKASEFEVGKMPNDIQKSSSTGMGERK